MLLPVVGDPYYSSVSLLVPMTGANSGTTFTDVSPIPKTVTRYNAITSTTQHKWGAGSGYFDGSGDYLSVADSADFAFGSSPFTVEFWMYPTANTGSGQYWGIVGQGDNVAATHSFMFYFNQNSAQIYCSLSTGSTLIYAEIVSSANNTLNAWHHYAISVDPSAGSIYRAFDGAVTLQSVSAFTLPNATMALEIGRNAGSYYLQGYLQDLRITKGVARYTAAYAVPTGLLPRRLGERPVHRRIVPVPTPHIAIARLGL